MASKKATVASSKDDAERLHYDYIRRSLERERRRPVPLPDLRFEQSYLRTLAPYVRVERTPAAQHKGKQKEGEGEAPPIGNGEVIHVEWGPVVWVTVRDQIIGPLVWGVLGYFYWPVVTAVRSNVHSWWARGASHPVSPGVDGHGVTWLRNWIGSLTATTGGTRKAFF